MENFADEDKAHHSRQQTPSHGNNTRSVTPSYNGARGTGSSAQSTLNDQQYPFYSNAASYAPSTTGGIELQQHLKPLKHDHIAGSTDTVVDADNQKHSQQFYTSDAEFARALAISENAPINGVDGEQIPKALHSPYVRNQLQALKVHRPYFLWTISFIQLVVLIVEMIVNSQKTGSVIAPLGTNPMIGPTVGVLIQTGARFTPCIRPHTPYDTVGSQLECPSGITTGNTVWSNGAQVDICTLDQICGMGGLNGQPPNQWFRFIIPVFLHGGVIHFLMNMSFQCRTGFQMEEDFGWWRMACIYLISGIGGFLFGGNYSGMSPSVGCSGALFGLIACLLIDLLQNWRLVKNPVWELVKLVFLIIISFLLGMLPYLDNFAHVGGFFCGFLAGLIFMPQIYFNKRDKVIKVTLQVIAVPLLILVYSLMIAGFYNVWNDCPWCKYLTCIPGMPWCEQKWGQALVAP
ncbi:UNVERIFIED_CONTAM: hypothetical protein HDU68_003059 [Siphonaria sp. JEL0065]|nr:hypothetical protein HDU68_003059 [Siphonaria sp. JEL0065]